MGKPLWAEGSCAGFERRTCGCCQRCTIAAAQQSLRRHLLTSRVSRCSLGAACQSLLAAASRAFNHAWLFVGQTGSKDILALDNASLDNLSPPVNKAWLHSLS